MALVCLCHGVNERRVRREIEHGAATIEEVAERCLAGSCCHGCHPTLDALLEEHEQLTAVRRRGARLPLRVLTASRRLHGGRPGRSSLLRAHLTAKIMMPGVPVRS